MALWQAAAAGYLLGSVPFAVLFGFLQRKNLLREGSGNPGALNAIRVLGWVPGLMVLTLDLAKGFLAVAYGEAMAGYAGALVAGAAAVWGHAYMPWLGFRGGKGIAPAFGAALAVAPSLVVGGLVVFAAAWVGTRHLYRASLVAAAGLPIVALVGRSGTDIALFALALAVPLVIKQRKDWLRAMA